MPNWVWNRVTVYGKPEQLEAFRKQAGAPTPLDPEPVFSFWNFIKPSDDIVEEYQAGDSLSVNNNSPNNWYNWNNREWGTKWDAHEPEFIDSDTGASIEYSFDTAWAPPAPVFKAMIEQFPELDFSIFYSEEQGWGGQIEASGGLFETVEEWDIPDSHEESMKRQGYCHCFGDETIYDDCPKEEEKAHSDISTVS